MPWARFDGGRGPGSSLSATQEQLQLPFTRPMATQVAHGSCRDESRYFVQPQSEEVACLLKPLAPSLNSKSPLIALGRLQLLGVTPRDQRLARPRLGKLDDYTYLVLVHAHTLRLPEKPQPQIFLEPQRICRLQYCRNCIVMRAARVVPDHRALLDVYHHCLHILASLSAAFKLRISRL